MFSEGPGTCRVVSNEPSARVGLVFERVSVDSDIRKGGPGPMAEGMEGVTEQREDEEEEKRVSTTREVEPRGRESGLMEPVSRIELERKIEPFLGFEVGIGALEQDKIKEEHLNSYKSKGTLPITSLFSDIKKLVGLKRNHETMSQSHENSRDHLPEEPLQTTKSHEHSTRTPEPQDKQPDFTGDLKPSSLTNGKQKWPRQDKDLAKPLRGRRRNGRKTRKRTGRRATVANHELTGRTLEDEDFKVGNVRRNSGKKSSENHVETRARQARIMNKVEKIRRFWNGESLLIPNVFKLFARIEGDFKNLLEFQDLSRKELLGKFYRIYNSLFPLMCPNIL